MDIYLGPTTWDWRTHLGTRACLQRLAFPPRQLRMVAFHLGVAFYGIPLISPDMTTSTAFTQELLSLSMLLRFVNTEHGTSQQYKCHCDSLYNQRGHVPHKAQL